MSQQSDASGDTDGIVFDGIAVARMSLVDRISRSESDASHGTHGGTHDALSLDAAHAASKGRAGTGANVVSFNTAFSACEKGASDPDYDPHTGPGAFERTLHNILKVYTSRKHPKQVHLFRAARGIQFSSRNHGVDLATYEPFIRSRSRRVHRQLFIDGVGDLEDDLLL